ncbi:hypothetical protein LNQ03_00010 [Klebsiella pneumoniae subsp. pneumoniae]|nr:hypothetical protein [Klebsiella pneumoniae subsp. pneumoniae]
MIDGTGIEVISTRHPPRPPSTLGYSLNSSAADIQPSSARLGERSVNIVLTQRLLDGVEGS